MNPANDSMTVWQINMFAIGAKESIKKRQEKPAQKCVQAKCVPSCLYPLPPVLVWLIHSPVTNSTPTRTATTRIVPIWRPPDLTFFREPPLPRSLSDLACAWQCMQMTAFVVRPEWRRSWGWGCCRFFIWGNNDTFSTAFFLSTLFFWGYNQREKERRGSALMSSLSGGNQQQPRTSADPSWSRKTAWKYATFRMLCNFMLSLNSLRLLVWWRVAQIEICKF